MNRIKQIFSYINKRKNPISNRITIGKIESSIIDSFLGVSYFTTALVPLFYLDKLMNSEEEAGHEVQFNGLVQIEELADLFKEKYYVLGLLNDNIYLEPLVISWRRHNKMVYIPEPKILMQYALIARFSGEKMYLDDPEKPQYGVIEVIPTSHYNIESGTSLAKVEIERDYLEDYAFLKNCAIVEFYFEERWVNTKEPEIEELLKNESCITLYKKNKKIKVLKTQSEKGYYNIQIWGRQNLLIPQKSPITNPGPIILDWPGYKSNCTEEDIKHSILDYVYVKDYYLQEYEDKKEFLLSPEHGSVYYQGWWSISPFKRIGRDYVCFELSKLYEGVPINITKNINKYVVTKDEVDKNIEKYGDINIGKRARYLIYSYLNLFNLLSKFLQLFDLFYDDEELCSYSKKEIEYFGWYYWLELRSLGNIAKHNFNENDFLNRCKILMNFFESIKEKPLRAFFKKINIDPKEIESKRTFKLLEMIMTLVKESISSGLQINTEIQEILNRIDFNERVPELSFLFYLYDIRVYASHKKGNNVTKKYDKLLKFFNIDIEYMKSNGWGTAIDRVFDKIIDSQNNLIEMINKCMTNI